MAEGKKKASIERARKNRALGGRLDIAQDFLAAAQARVRINRMELLIHEENLPAYLRTVPRLTVWERPIDAEDVVW